MFSQLKRSAYSVGVYRKPRFQYQLPLVGAVCRACWTICVGYPRPKNNRVLSIEAKIRAGATGPEPKMPRVRPLSTTTYAVAFIKEYIFKHSQSSPSDKVLYVDFLGHRELYARYKKEVNGAKTLKAAYFKQVWNKTLCMGVVDPETAVRFEVRVRKGRAKGFAKCDKCQYYKQQIAGAVNATTRAAKERRLAAHMTAIDADRETLTRVQRLCITRHNHVGFFLDAADSNKFGIPSTRNVGKCMSKLWTIKQKLTCAQMFNSDKTLYMFRTMPYVPTGGNLTATIVCALIDKLDMTGVTDLWINIDGSGDNINYTLYYVLAHLLLCAKDAGWPLKKFHLLRMKVGHTHCDLDATFAALSKFVYGKHSRGVSKKNIFSLSSFKEV